MWGALSPSVVSLGSVVRASARRRLACGARRPLFSDIVEGGGQSPLYARSAWFGVFVRCVGTVWTVPRLGGSRARRRFAGRLFFDIDAESHSTLLTSARTATFRLTGTAGATSAVAVAARAATRSILARLRHRSQP